MYVCMYVCIYVSSSPVSVVSVYVLHVCMYVYMYVCSKPISVSLCTQFSMYVVYVCMYVCSRSFCICTVRMYVCTVMYVGVCVAYSEEADVAGVSRGREAQRQVLVRVLSGSPALHRGRRGSITIYIVLFHIIHRWEGLVVCMYVCTCTCTYTYDCSTFSSTL